MIWFQAFIHLVLPVLLFVHLLRTAYSKRTYLLIDWAAVLMFMAFIFVIGPWHMFTHYMRWLLPLSFLIVSVFVYRRWRSLPEKSEKKRKGAVFSMVISLLLILYFGSIAVSGLSGYALPEEDKGVAMEFPMKHGVYALGHGGASTSINYHYESKTQAYAYDILKVNALTVRADGLSPASLEDYEIYGEPLYSPCTGEVTAAVDEYEDILPQAEPDKEQHPAGNHLILSCQGVDVHIAHMKPGTVHVQEGDAVEAGHLLGEVGNTGNTTEPHLHIHAEKDGEGVPLTFHDRFLKRNSLVFQ
ncbi:M23 family metallopeptidase [Halobacillus litoralis]|uniref:M23 family metallopeptidase n=1 Tax=Halobacillus litoralis TaxID=45668 RepID=UPI001CD3AD0D|nr:M23 family metallopeptidase [Halobacillus litoralis]MCA1023661.1 M23 family metallopeptidase [Halobacillus litoralis]